MGTLQMYKHFSDQFDGAALAAAYQAKKKSQGALRRVMSIKKRRYIREINREEEALY